MAQLLGEIVGGRRLTNSQAYPRYAVIAEPDGQVEAVILYAHRTTEIAPETRVPVRSHYLSGLSGGRTAVKGELRHHL